MTGSSESFCRMSHLWLWRDPECPAWTGILPVQVSWLSITFYPLVTPFSLTFLITEWKSLCFRTIMSCCSKSLLKTICFYWTCWMIKRKRKTYHSKSQALFNKSLKFLWSETSQIYIYYSLILAANGRRRKRKNHIIYIFILAVSTCSNTWHLAYLVM